MISLPLARYRLEFEVETPLHLPAYAGSTLRGVFGGALRFWDVLPKPARNSLAVPAGAGWTLTKERLTVHFRVEGHAERAMKKCLTALRGQV